MSVPDFPPGRVLAGKYALTAPLGRTPWAATYRASVGPGQEVAVKVLDAALAEQPLLLDAIVRAGSAASAVPQPSALAVLEHGKDPETGALFIVTRLSAFPSLAFHLERGPLPPEVAIAVVRALAQALDTLHAAGQAHLALKPTNVFVGPSPGYPIEIADFGANAIRALVPDEVRQSFSAPWLAPEQIANDSMATASSDVFAMALVAFAALTGKSFWRSCSGPAPDLQGWRAEVIAPPGRASQRGAEIGVALHPAFDNVFGRALSVPRDRFATAGELARALSEAFENSRGDAAFRPVAADAGAVQGLPYAATLPRPEGASFGGPGGGVAGPAPGPSAMGAPPPVQAVAAPTPSLGPPLSVAGVPKKGGKGWLIAVAALVLLGLGVGFYFVQRARAAQALASAEAAAASASAAAASASASASAAAASASAALAMEAPAASASAVEAPASAAAAAPDQPTSADAGAAAPAPPSTNAAAAEPTPPPAPQAPSTASPQPPSQPEAPSQGTASRPPSSDHGPPPAATGAAGAPASTGGAAGAHKKPCGKFLERCPDSGS